jgi:hypothetical protein
MDGKGRWMDNVFIERLWRSVKYEEIYLFDQALAFPEGDGSGILPAWLDPRAKSRPDGISQFLGKTGTGLFGEGDVARHQPTRGLLAKPARRLVEAREVEPSTLF